MPGQCWTNAQSKQRCSYYTCKSCQPGQKPRQCSDGSLNAPLGPLSFSLSPQHPWALATLQRSLPTWSQGEAKDQSLAFLLVSMLRVLWMVLMSALINLCFGQERR